MSAEEATVIRIHISAVEHPEEREHRLRELSRDARLRRAKDTITWMATWTLILGLVLQVWNHLGSGR